MEHKGKRNSIRRFVVVAVALLAAVVCQAQTPERAQPYKSYTGTVHQFGFIGGLYYTANPNYKDGTEQDKTYHDYGLGVVYNLHDYVTPQFTFDFITSVTLVTTKALEQPGYSDSKQKIIWPFDCRFAIGPSEDFQLYAGTGLQWNMLQKTTGSYSLTTGTAPTKTIHQLCGNTAAGLNILGPQKYMVHLNLGAKFHYPITDNDDIAPDDPSLIDLSKDRGCVVLNGGLTLDLDRRKTASVMLSYEYPLGSLKADDARDGGFFTNTQTIALSLVFHIGGTR